MTTTYTLDNHPWRTDGKLRKRLDNEVHARNLAHTSVDLLGVVAAYAGQSYDGTQKTNLFPGRALVTRELVAEDCAAMIVCVGLCLSTFLLFLWPTPSIASCGTRQLCFKFRLEW